MMYLIQFIILFIVMGTLSSLAGDSFPVRKVNQKLKEWFSFGGKIPEMLVGTVVGVFFLYLGDRKFNWVENYVDAFPITSVTLLFTTTTIFFLVLVFGSFVAMVGKESATVFHLPTNWEGWSKDTDGDGDIDEDDLRKSTMRIINDFIAKFFNVSLTGPVYPKIWCTTKGFLVSIPILGLVAPFNALSRHVWIHIGRFMNAHYGHSVNSYAEFGGDGMALAAGLTLATFLVVG